MRQHEIVEYDIGIIEKFIKILESAKNVGDTIFDVFPVIFILTDNHGKILKANRLAQDLLYLAEDRLLGRYLDDVTPESAAREFHAFFRDVAQKPGGKIEFETKGVNRRGEEQYIFWQVNTIADVKEFPVSLNIIVASDITQLRKGYERIAAIENELEISQAIQNHLLPQRNEFENEYFHVYGYYRAADKVGGDWWWYEVRENDKLHLFLGDVTGHGVGSAMVTAKIASAYSVISRKAAKDASMFQLIEELNASVFWLNDPLHSMSVFGAACDPHAKKAELCFCGSSPILLLSKNRPSRRYLQRSDCVGWREHICIGQDWVEFASQDRLVAFTDGSYEFNDRNGHPFNMRKITKLAEKFADMDAKAACDNLVEEINLARGGSYSDDMSLVIVDRK